MKDILMNDSPRKETSAPQFSPWTWSHDIGPAPGEQRRYLRRLVLLVGLIVLVTIWFQLHIQPYVTEVFFVGGTLTLWGLWKIVQSSWLQWGDGGKPQPVVRRWLSKPLAGELMTLGLILAALLFVGTSSIYCSFEGARPGEDSYEVEILEEGRPFMQGMTVESSSRMDGRPFFLRWRPVHLTFRIKGRTGWEPLPKSFWPGMPLRLDVPDDFERMRLKLLRLVPGSGLLGDELARPGPGIASSGHFLRVKVGRKVSQVSDLRFQTLYLGASAEDLAGAMTQEERERFGGELKNYLRDLRMPEDQWDDYLAAWQDKPLALPGIRLPKSGKITVSIGQGGRVLKKLEVNIRDEDGIRTEFLEIPVPPD